jgi:2-haloacid dehalogenase
MAASTVFFDVNETLTDLSFLEAEFATLGLNKSDLDIWFARVLRDAFALTVTESSAAFFEIGTELLAQMVRTAGGKDDSASISQVVKTMAQLPPHPDVKAGISQCYEAELSMFTLSNGSTAAAEFIFDHLGIRHMISDCLSVAGQALWKPNKDAYEFGLSRAKVAAEQAVLVAVHPWDIHGARQAGMHAVWVNRSGGGYPSYFSWPSAEITSLMSLAETIKGL